MFINLKQLKDNIGEQITLVLKSKGEFEKKEYNGKSWNSYKYQVELDNQMYDLDATDALHRKISVLKLDSKFNLSYEEFTTNEGTNRNYWKIEDFEEPVYEDVKNPSKTNDFDTHVARVQAMSQEKQDHVKSAAEEVSTVSDKIKQENVMRMNGARFGMIFNNVVRIFIANGMNMTTSDIVDCFNRVESWVDVCETTEEKPFKLPEAKVEEKKVENKIEEPVEITDDDLPF
tara:strand:- start:67 stop:759 length:693 start_codon:yes stop_codon:yes gene_type:complete